MSFITEYDAAWKATPETFLQPCLALAFPALADQINWSVPPRWRPEPFAKSFAGCSLRFQHATCKLMDLDLERWIAAGNPVARVIEAHRMAQKTGKDVKERRSGKLSLVRQLSESGMDEAEVREVMRLIHWLLALPEEEEIGFRKDVRDMEASMQTKRRSTYERIVWQEGRSEGRVEGRHSAARDLLLDLIRVRFSGCPPSIQSQIESIHDEARLRELALAVVTTASAAEFESLVVGGDH